jgi:hypothetical protein
LSAHPPGIDCHIDVKGGDDLQAHAKKVIEPPADGVARMKKILGD